MPHSGCPICSTLQQQRWALQHAAGSASPAPGRSLLRPKHPYLPFQRCMELLDAPGVAVDSKDAWSHMKKGVSTRSLRKSSMVLSLPDCSVCGANPMGWMSWPWHWGTEMTGSWSSQPGKPCLFLSDKQQGSCAFAIKSCHHPSKRLGDASWGGNVLDDATCMAGEGPALSQLSVQAFPHLPARMTENMFFEADGSGRSLFCFCGSCSNTGFIAALGCCCSVEMGMPCGCRFLVASLLHGTSVTAANGLPVGEHTGKITWEDGSKWQRG